MSSAKLPKKLKNFWSFSSGKLRSKSEKLDFLLAIYIACVLIAELMGAKTFTIGFLTASVAIFTLPVTFIINDVITEVEGRERARSFLRTALLMLIFLTGYTVLALALPVSQRFAAFEPAYQTIFAKSLRMTLASLVAFFVAERLDILIFSQIRARMQKKALWLRSNVSNIVSLFGDTSIFMFLAFYEPGNAGFVWALILPYWALKCLVSLVETPVTYQVVAWLKNEKQVD
jgi:uncharacterized integral membrane protein (TIGR00697 family)